MLCLAYSTLPYFPRTSPKRVAPLASPLPREPAGTITLTPRRRALVVCRPTAPPLRQPPPPLPRFVRRFIPEGSAGRLALRPPSPPGLTSYCFGGRSCGGAVKARGGQQQPTAAVCSTCMPGNSGRCRRIDLSNPAAAAAAADPPELKTQGANSATNSYNSLLDQ